MSTSWGLPSAFYDPFFSEPLLGADFDMLDFDMGPSEWSGQPGGGASWPQLAGRGGEPCRAVQTGQQQQQPGGNRAQRRAARRTARVNLLQEEDKYLVCVEVAGRTKNDLCVALEGNMLKVCGKALYPDEEEEQQQREHFTGQPEQGRTPIQGPPGEQSQEKTQKQQQAGGQSAGKAEGKEAELSGGEKLAERREGGQQTQAGQQQQSGQAQPGQQQQPAQKQRRYLLHEFPVGRIERTIRLPADAQEEGIQARCENGILHVCVPRLPKKRPVEIQ